KVDGGGHAHVLVEPGGPALPVAFGTTGFVGEYDPRHPELAVCSRLPTVAFFPTLFMVSPLALDGAGAAYVGLTTDPPDLASSGAYQPTNAGSFDTFATKVVAGAGDPIATCLAPTTTTTLPRPQTCVPATTTTTLPPPETCAQAPSGEGLSGARCRL